MDLTTVSWQQLRAFLQLLQSSYMEISHTPEDRHDDQTEADAGLEAFKADLWAQCRRAAPLWLRLQANETAGSEAASLATIQGHTDGVGWPGGFDWTAELTSVAAKSRAKMRAIDRRTARLIAQGFEYDDGGGPQTYSLGDNQADILGARMVAGEVADWDSILWPNIDDTFELDLTTKEQVTLFTKAGMDRASSVRVQGTVLKKACRLAQTLEDLDAVVDDR